MQLTRNAQNFPFSKVANGSVATIGAYDGIHLGHQRLLDCVVAEARNRGVPSVVMSFEPMPREFFATGSPPARLMRFREKYDSLRAYGIDIFFCPRFDRNMRNISADSFIRQLLIHAMNVDHLVIGDDFRFAKDRQGHVEHLERAGAALGFTLQQVPSVRIDGKRVSSTAIREALWQGNLDVAGKFLGRHYRMSGRVERGKRVGRQLGYPTANVAIQRRQSAVLGIFAVRVSGPDWGPLDAVANVGTRPTFGGVKPLVEVHIFDFDREIYGQYIHVDFVARLRSELKFDNVDALIEQMHKDSADAKAILAA
ncbi:MAG: bifunctional riboflavin kinase/FAD synthetase [Gammaproteobacteria bacterium]|nr:bifunctional riboflavin kinase/FAD synthetase [Gammaproteobacteria bacterium]